MTDLIQEETQVQERDELTLLKAQADRMGITYSKNISATTLKSKINEKLEAAAVEAEVDEEEADETTRKYLEATKLIRIILTPIDATKASNLDCDVFSVSNDLVGTITRTIPFGREWHVEQILLNSIKEKKFQQFTNKKNAQGVQVTTARLVQAYAVSILDPLTPEELKELADQQARTGALAEE